MQSPSELRETSWAPRSRLLGIYVDVLLCLAGILGAFVSESLAAPLAIRFVFATLLLLVLPGYCLLAAAYPLRQELMKRLPALVGVSLVANCLLLICISYSIGLGIWDFLGADVVLMLTCCTIVQIRRDRSVGRSDDSRHFKFPRFVPVLQSTTMLTLFAGVFALVGLGRLVWITTHTMPVYSEFYALGMDGKAGDYSLLVDGDQVFEVTLGVVNHGDDEDFGIRAQVDSGKWLQLAQFSLSDGEKWQKTVPIPLPYSEGFHEVQVVLRSTRPQSEQKNLVFWPLRR